MRKSQNDRGTTNIVVGMLIGVGLLTTLAGLVWLSSELVFLLTGSHAEGVIVRIEKGHGKGTSYAAVFEFRDSESKLHQATNLAGPVSNIFSENERVSVLYHRSSPTEGKIVSFFTLWMAPLVITGFGVVFTLGAWSEREEDPPNTTGEPTSTN